MPLPPPLPRRGSAGPGPPTAPTGSRDDGTGVRPLLVASARRLLLCARCSPKFLFLYLLCPRFQLLITALSSLCSFSLTPSL